MALVGHVEAMLSCLEDLDEATTPEAIQGVIEEIGRRDPIRFVGVRWMRGSASTNRSALRFSTLPLAYREEVERLGLFRSDPLMKRLFSATAPVLWDKAYGEELPPDHPLVGVAAKHGIDGNGISVPIRGPYASFSVIYCALNCTRAEFPAIAKAFTPALTLAGQRIHDRLLAILQGELKREHALSDRETSCLALAAAGLRIKQIANRLGLADQTVNFYLTLARAKLNAANTPEAAARAVSYGLINLDGPA